MVSAAIDSPSSRTRTGSPWVITMVTALGPATWGTTYYVTTEWLPPDRPLLAATVRALPAGLLILALTRQLPRGVWWLRAGALGVLNIGLFFALLFLSAYRLPGGVAATLGAAQPLLVTLFAVGLLAQPVRAHHLLCGIGGLVGVGLMVLTAEAALDIVGVVAGLAGAASMALGVVMAKRWGRPDDVDVLPFTGWLLTAGGLFLLPLAVAFEDLPATVTSDHVVGFTYLALVNTTFGYFVWLRGLERLPARNVAFLSLVSPVVAVLVGAVVLGELFTVVQGVGVVLALASLLLAQWPSRTTAGSSRTVPKQVGARGVVAAAPLTTVGAEPR